MQGEDVREEDHVASVVEQWQRQRPDLDVRPLLVVGRLERVWAHFDAALRPLFADAGLGDGDFNVLAALRRAGEPFALSPSQLADSTLVTRGAVTKRVDRLLGQGLVTRRSSTGDGRGRVVTLTAAGVTLVDDLITQHLRTEEGLLSGLSWSERNQLADLLARLNREVGPRVGDHQDDATGGVAPGAAVPAREDR